MPSPWKSWLQVQVKPLAVMAHVAAEWQLWYSGAHKTEGKNIIYMLTVHQCYFLKSYYCINKIIN